mmetsp:Transcript_66827/g.150948  ORF Transcript_66827/g.150948 Transcript_66827/m.150948 type:complete len:677 (-) Transcript_66827:249-2279(-)
MDEVSIDEDFWRAAAHQSGASKVCAPDLTPDEKEACALVIARLPVDLAPLASPNLTARTVRSYWGYPDRISSASAGLARTIAWRLEERADDMLRRKVERAAGYRGLWTTTVHGVDGAGRLVFADRACRLKADELHTNFGGHEVLRHRAQEMEVLAALQAHAAHAVGYPTQTELVYIHDLEGLGFAQLTRRTLAVGLAIVSMYENHYPGALGSMWLLNAPSAFLFAWRLIRPLLSQQTAEKINILGGVDEYLPRLLSAGVPLAALPSWMRAPPASQGSASASSGTSGAGEGGLCGTHRGVELSAFVAGIGQPREGPDEEGPEEVASPEAPGTEKGVGAAAAIGLPMEVNTLHLTKPRPWTTTTNSLRLAKPTPAKPAARGGGERSHDPADPFNFLGLADFEAPPQCLAESPATRAAGATTTKAGFVHKRGRLFGGETRVALGLRADGAILCAAVHAPSAGVSFGASSGASSGAEAAARPKRRLEEEGGRPGNEGDEGGCGRLFSGGEGGGEEAFSVLYKGPVVARRCAPYWGGAFWLESKYFEVVPLNLVPFASKAETEAELAQAAVGGGVGGGPSPEGLRNRRRRRNRRRVFRAPSGEAAAAWVLAINSASQKAGGAARNGQEGRSSDRAAATTSLDRAAARSKSPAAPRTQPQGAQPVGAGEPWKDQTLGNGIQR